MQINRTRVCISVTMKTVTEETQNKKEDKNLHLNNEFCLKGNEMCFLANPLLKYKTLGVGVINKITVINTVFHMCDNGTRPEYK